MQQNTVYKLLVVDAPHYYAAAEWKKDKSGWSCTRAAPVLAWMIGMKPQKAKEKMDKLGYKRFWTEVKPRLS